ncbi:MAG: addiction module protein [Thermoguttaceae bacterium]|jgi:putative addiction module component (TIGR02574 family)
MSTLQEIIDAARALPAGERARLIEALWDTTTPEDWAPPSEEWIAESQRRSEQYDAGRMTASPWPEVRDRARRKAGMDG